MFRILAAIALTLCAGSAWAVTCKDITFQGNNYTLCEVDTAQEDLRLFLYDAQGQPYGHFTTLDEALKAENAHLAFAMNAGMYHADRSPVGHYLENGTERRGVIASAGPGNFGLLPNGILCLHQGRADVIETLRFQSEQPACTSATQSGPMLVIDGALHQRFLPDSTSRYIRNGVGTSADGTRAVFAMSNTAVTFHDFGLLFRDHLKLPQALYFDGNISRLHAPMLSRSDPGFRMGPIIGVVEAD